MLRKTIYHSSISFNVVIIIIQTDEILMLFSMKKEEANRFIVDYKSGKSWSKNCHEMFHVNLVKNKMFVSYILSGIYLK